MDGNPPTNITNGYEHTNNKNICIFVKIRIIGRTILLYFCLTQPVFLDRIIVE